MSCEANGGLLQDLLGKQFPKKKSKGRPKCKTETLPRTDFGVDWEEIAKSNGMD